MAEIFPETPITSLPDAVAFLGAPSMPDGPQPLALSEAQIDALTAAGNRVVNDEVHQHLCMCDAWPESCVSTGNYYMGAWDVSGLEDALPAVLGLWESMRGGELAALRAQVADLLAERHTTNEALSEAAEALRADRGVGCSCPPQDRPHQVGCQQDGVPDRLTQTFASVAALREDPHDSPLHHDYRIPHDLPESCRLDADQADEVSRRFIGGA